MKAEMKRYGWLAFMALTAPAAALAAQVQFSGTSLRVLTADADRNSGLDAVFVAYDTKGIVATFTDPAGSNAKWFRYSQMGGGYAEPVADVAYDGSSSSVSGLEGDLGYMVEYGEGKRYSFWLVDYSRHRLELKGIAPAADQECESTGLQLSGSGAPIHYYSINGRQLTLDQQITISYYNLEWDGEQKLYRQVEARKELESFQENVALLPPVYTTTTFKAEGDRFLQAWNWAESCESDTFRPVAVACFTEAEQLNLPDESEEASNVIKGDDSGLGGSAPAEIEFLAYATDSVLHHEWQMSQDPEFETIDYRFNQQDLTYTFTNEGTYYLRYVGSNSDGSCETVGDTYTVSIGASELKCPNAFSPGVSEGVNDVWKVSYRSIVDFECHIFDRYGTEMCSFTDPSDGWDGKHGGKYVKPGVYYYVIKAEGADGKRYKLSGDINIIGYRRGGASSGTVPAE